MCCKIVQTQSERAKIKKKIYSREWDLLIVVVEIYVRHHRVRERERNNLRNLQSAINKISDIQHNSLSNIIKVSGYWKLSYDNYFLSLRRSCCEKCKHATCIPHIEVYIN